MNTTQTTLSQDSAGYTGPLLIAEDDLIARTMLTGVLKKWGYDVIAASDGNEAWEILQQPGSPLLIILDWMMPGMDGVEIIQRVRKSFTGQQPYMILLTSKDEKGDILSGLESGANDYIKKPFDHEELYARIRVGQRTLELQTQLYESQQTLAHLATHDSLTGIYNRRAILLQLSRDLSRFLRGESASDMEGLSIGFFDIDNFKRINDQFGHQVGDELLCALVDTLVSRLRVYDSFGRLGGDEFLIVAPGLNETNRENLFNRLTIAVAATPFKTSIGEISTTVSIGIASANAGSCVDQMLERADTAMYRAKQAGGNKVAYA